MPKIIKMEHCGAAITPRNVSTIPATEGAPYPFQEIYFDVCRHCGLTVMRSVFIDTFGSLQGQPFAIKPRKQSAYFDRIRQSGQLQQIKGCWKVQTSSREIPYNLVERWVK